jgi:alanine racemase
VATVFLDAIAHNYRTLCQHADPACTVAPVLKADAYGLGMIPLAHHLARSGAGHFFVATIEEGLRLRAHGPTGCAIYVLNGLWRETMHAAADASLTPVLSTEEQVRGWRQVAHRLGCPLDGWLQIETGLNRLGLPPTQAERLLTTPMLLESLNIKGIMSHLASSYQAHDPFNDQQREIFHTVQRMAPKNARRSLANSGGLLLGNHFHYDVARVGRYLYGLIRRRSAQHPVLKQLRIPLELKARILQVGQMKKGDTAGYDQTFTATSNIRLATCSCGYGDGYPRSLSNKGVAEIDGHRVPIVGRISMDLMMVDVTEIPEEILKRSTWITLMGPTLSPSFLAHEAAISPWEVITQLGKRALFRYVDGNATNTSE